MESPLPAPPPPSPLQLNSKFYTAKSNQSMENVKPYVCVGVSTP